MQEPQDPMPWEGILEADHFAPMSMQPVNLPIYDSLATNIGYHDYQISLRDNYRPPVSEDSLYVNVWKPAGAREDLPVLVHVHNEQQLLHGYNSRESGPFLLFSQASLKNFEGRVCGCFGESADAILALYPVTTNAEAGEAWAEVYGAVFFDYPHYCLNRLAAENGIPVYEYYFSRDNGRLGAWHSGQEVYCYGNIPDDSGLYGARDRELSAEMLKYWRNFARAGDPNGDGLPRWEQNAASADLMGFGDETGMLRERQHELFAILDQMDGWSA